MIQSPAVIFDLDGTLVDTDAFDGALYIEAVREVVGDVDVDSSWRSYRNVTDAGVLAQILEESGLSDAEHLKVRVRDVFGSKMQRHLQSGGCQCIPGAKAAIENLLGAGYAVGIATGGWGHTARMKLAHVGIAFEHLVLSSSDDSIDRVEIMSACLRRMRGTPDRAVYVGDGRWDLEASRRAGWQFVGVGEKLRGQCTPWIADFTDPEWQMMHNNALYLGSQCSSQI